MRKALIAVIVASALFAVGAFAADFALTAEDTASGADEVDACTDTVLVEFDERFDNGAGESNTYVIDSVDLTLAAGHTCSGAEVEIVLQDNDAASTVTATVTGTWAGTGTTQSFAVTEVPVANVWDASVLFDGQNVDQTP